MARLTLFALLGAADLPEAARRWPRSTFLPGLGLSAGSDDAEDYEPLLQYLDDVLTFTNVRPGSDPGSGRVGITAEVVVAPHPTPPPLVLRQLPDFGFVLRDNPADAPARVFVTQADTGVEVVVEGLPVEIQLPHGLLGPLRSEAEELQGPGLVDVTQGGPFLEGAYDTYEVVLSELGASRIRVHLRVRFTEEREVVLEPAVPLSVGPCRFSGLPCDGVHDLGLLPYPTLSGDHTEHELATEWVRHRLVGGLGSADAGGPGLVTVRTLDLAHHRDPLRSIVDRFTDEDAKDGLEFTLEDLVLPVSVWLTPVATHGRFGLRRAVLQQGDEAEAYDMTLAPVEIELGGGLDWQLKVFRLLFETPDTVVARLAVVPSNDPDDQDRALLVDVSDGWLLQGAWVPEGPVELFEVANVRVSFMTVRLGFLLRGIQDAQGAAGFMDHVRILVDLGVAVGEDDNPQIAQFEVPARPPGAELGQDVVLRNLGWDLGEKALFPDLWFPEDVKLTVFRVVQVQVEEIAFLNEDNGGRYLSFSGGISVFPGAGDPERTPRDATTPGLPAEGQPDGGGIRVRRLRFRTGGNELAPRWGLDGVSLHLRKGRFELIGQGSITDVTRDGHRYQEVSLGLFLRFGALGNDFSVGAQVFYGRVTGPVDEFTYWLFGLLLPMCPLGSYELRDISLLHAGGMAPNLPAPSGKPQEMRLLDWYRAHRVGGATEVRTDRAPQRGGWKVEPDAEAAGLGLEISLSVSKGVTLQGFVFVHRSRGEAGILVAAEVFILRCREPVGIGAIEVDLARDRWSALIGVDLDFAKLLDTDSALAKGLARVTGTIFAGNDPGTFAIGQLADQASWLTFAANKSIIGLSARVSLGFCLQISASPHPRGFGFVATAAAKGSLGIGRVELYASLGVLVGTWGNTAGSSGILIWAEVALRIKVFYVFSFGARVKAVLEQLGPSEPNYKRLALEVRIETPWWLPDVTFRVERVSSTPAPEDMPVVSSPLVAASAIEPSLTAVPLAVPSATPGSVFSVAELRALPDQPIPQLVWDSLTPVSVDATIALDFAVSVGNETTVVPSTAVDAGLQAPTPPAQNKLTARYTLVRVGIRRRPLYGAGAGVWTDLLAPASTEVGGLDDLLDDPDLSVTFASAVRFRWDADLVKDNAVDPRRLLVNADTPYSFVTGNPGTDEGLLATDPSYPCCGGKRTPPSYRLDFADVPLGVRSPVVKPFVGSRSALRWSLVVPPVVAGSPVDHVARVLPPASDAVLGTVTFDEPAHTVDLVLAWRPTETQGPGSVLVVEAYRGLEVVDRQLFPHPAGGPPVPVHCRDGDGITSLTLRWEHGAPPETGDRVEAVELRSIRYRTVREVRDSVADQGRCRASGSVAGGGKLAWLPNHDYEVQVSVRATVDHDGSAQDAEVVQRAGFRTRGLPGLNAVEAVGQELEPYVESVYPGATRLLYRSEPVVVAFDERISSLLPVDRTPVPGAVPEHAQLLEWVLAVGSADGPRWSVPSADWVVAHRGAATPAPRWPRVIDDLVLRSSVRSAPTTSALRDRLESLEALSPSCGASLRLHSSQVLVHQPVDDLWPARTDLRVAVRGKGGAYVARDPFEPEDLSALTVTTPWQLADGAIGVPAAAAGRQLALLGEPDWDHVQLHTVVDPAGGTAGLGVGMAGASGIVVVVDPGSGSLRIQTRSGADLAAAELPAVAVDGYALTVTVYDDLVEARVGDVVARAARGANRNGRVALVATPGARFRSLHVDAIEAFVSQVTTSRYATFEEHIGSWDRSLRTLPVSPGPVAGLRSTSPGPQLDSQARQREFDRWTSTLALPLTGAVDGLRFSAIEDAAGTHLFLLESPEPLPCGTDVSVTLTHEVTAFPGGHPPLPRPWLAFAAGLRFRRTRVAGTVPDDDDVAADVRRARHLVRAVEDRLTRRVEFEVYAVSVDGSALAGELTEVRRTPPFGPGPPRRSLPAGAVVLLDRFDEPVSPVLPLPVTTIEVVDLAVLSDAAEDKALLVPATPLPAGDYDLTLSLDRPRYRSAVVDGTTNHQASVTLSVTL